MTTVVVRPKPEPIKGSSRTCLQICSLARSRPFRL
jgi:hypothetical protein